MSRSAMFPNWVMKLLWPMLALGLLLLFNLAFTPNFFHVEIRDGRLYGTLIDILNHGSKVMLLALGMTLVIATGGIDLSVGAVMAIAGAVAAKMVVSDGVCFSVPASVAADLGVPNLAGTWHWPLVGFPAAVAAALGVSVLAGTWNGLLVGALRIQPMVATLILMVAGRGVAQLITDGQIITFTDPRLVFLGNGGFLGLPFPILIVALMLLVTSLLTRKTALGLFIESVGDNQTACHYAGLRPREVKFLAYTFAGLCAGMAGLVAASNIRGADSNHAGLSLELDAILAVVVGGTALTGGRFYLLGSMVGALLIQTLTTTMYMRDVSADVAPVPKAMVIVAVCLLQSPAFRQKVTMLWARKVAA